MPFGLKINASSGTTAKTGNLSTQPISLAQLSPIVTAAIQGLNTSVALPQPPLQGLNPAVVAKAATTNTAPLLLPTILLPEVPGLQTTDNIKSAARDSFIDRQFSSLDTPPLALRESPALAVARGVAAQRDNVPALVARERRFADQLTDSAAVRNIRAAVGGEAGLRNLQIANFNRLVTPRVSGPDRLDGSVTRVQNGVFRVESLGGISSLRPEVVALLNYRKLYGDEVVTSATTNYTPDGKLLSLLSQLRILRIDTLDAMRNAMVANPELNDLFQTALQNNTDTWKTVKKNLDFFTQNYSKINALKKAFDVTEIAPDKYALAKFLPLDLFYQRKMQFSRQSYESFTDTKLLGQLLIDYRAVLEKYSYGLLNVVDTDRINDYNPVRLDTTYTTQNGFTFNIEGVRGQLSFKEAEFTSFGNSMPSSMEDRLKLLMVVLSKELRVSKGLTKPDVRQTLKDYYQAQNVDGVPFDNIIGAPGDDIFGTPLGANSLCSLLQVKDGTTLILPFEQKVIDDTQTTFVPGTKYFIDTIMDGTTAAAAGFNTEPVKDYVSQFSDKLFNAKKLIESLFEFTNETGYGLSPYAAYTHYLTAIKSGTKLLTEDVVNTGYKAQLILLAVLQLAAKNKDLKYLVYQYLLLVGIATFPRRTDQKFFKRISDEIKVIQNLPGVEVPDGLEVNIEGGFELLHPYLVKLATKIEKTIEKALGVPASKLPSKAGLLKAASESNPTNARTAEGSLLKGFALRTVADTNSRRIGGKKASHMSARTGANGNASAASEQITQANGHSVLLKSKDISDALLSMANTNTLASSNLFKEFIEMCYKFDQLASIQGNELAYTSLRADLSQVSLTRFNQLTTSTLALIVLETFIAFVSKFMSGTFTYDNGDVGIGYDVLKNTFVINTIAELIPQAVATPNIQPSTPTKTAPDRLTSNGVGGALLGKQDTSGVLAAKANQRSGLTQNASKLASTNGNTQQAGKTAVSGLYPKPLRDSLIGPERQRINPTGTGDAMTIRNPLLGRGTGHETDAEAIARAAGIGGRLFDEFTRDAIPSDVITRGLTIYGNLRRSLFGIKDKLLEEDVTTQNFLHILEVIGDNLAVVTKSTTVYFESFGAQETAMVQANAQNIYATQLRTSKWIYDTMDSQIRASSLSSKPLHSSELNAMFSLFREPVFRSTLANARLKMLVVGVPYGLTDKLLDRVAKRNIDRDTIQAKQADLIRIAVHKKTAEDDDVVFYPKRFLFDMSLYPEPLKAQTITDAASFDNYLREYSLADYSSFTKELTPFFNVGMSQKYDILSSAEKTQLGINHVVSQLLQLYTYINTGVSLDEGTFPLSSYTNYSVNAGVLPVAVSQLLQQYLVKERQVPTELASLPVNELLTNSRVAADLRDDLKLLTYGASILNPMLMQQKVLSQKKFDRVFIVPLNIDDFIIDEALTKSTSSGVATTEKVSYQKKAKAVSVGDNSDLFYFDRSQEPNALIFDDYFVTIESVL